MRLLPFTFCLLYTVTISFAQNPDLKTYPSGLIYNDKTMKQLDKIVDSINTKFLSCELNKKFYPKFQGFAHYVYMKQGAKNKAKKDIENNISFEEFEAKYKSAKITKDLFIIQNNYTNYDGEKISEYENLGKGFKIEIKEGNQASIEKGTWVVDYNSIKSNYLKAFYLKSELTNSPLVEKYARMVQYSDCMVDTNALIFTKNSAYSPTGLKVKKFIDYVSEITSKPKWSEENDNYYEELKTWEIKRFETLTKEFENKEIKEKFNQLFKNAISQAKVKGGSTEEFEEYVDHYGSKKNLLALKRSRKVYGSCSMDTSPRIHAKAIAKLSAETANWETFLRSHLDIMNDRFERRAYSSYGDASFSTYIGELEALDINVPDLMLGISLRLSNPSLNHYYGTIHRIGRALSETKYADEIEARMLTMIGDNELDGYNRMIIYYLFSNYNSYIKNEEKKKVNLAKLKALKNKLPKHIVEYINSEEH